MVKSSVFLPIFRGAKSEVHHEAFQDFPGVPVPEMVVVDRGRVDWSDVPGTKDAPPLDYDYPSGGYS